MSVFLANLLKPFVLLGILGGLLFCRYLVIWFMKDGKLKRLLLLRVDYAGQAERRRSRAQAQDFGKSGLVGVLETKDKRTGAFRVK